MVPVTSIGSVGHSARVEMALIVDGVARSIVQMGPDFIILERAASHPPAEAEIHLSVDDNKEKWTVYLPNGLRPNERRVITALAA
jgi:hypothetical protein